MSQHKPGEAGAFDPVSPQPSPAAQPAPDADAERQEAERMAAAQRRANAGPVVHPPKLLGPYELDRPIGRGAHGIVYRARQVSLDRPAAVKVLNPALGADPEFISRFDREARLAAKLVHPHLVMVYDTGHFRGFHWLGMELIDGQSVARIVKTHGPFPIESALLVVQQVASALDYAASAGILHRDVKPSNILLGPDGNARVADLGLAKEGPVTPTSEHGNFAVGSPRYIAPERLIDRGRADVRADIYSLGLTLIRMITGELPLVAENDIQTMRRHIHEDVPLPGTKVMVPPVVDAIVALMVAREPDARYSDALALANDITALLTGGTPPIAGSRVAPGAPTSFAAVPGIVPQPPPIVGTPTLTPGAGLPAVGPLPQYTLSPAGGGEEGEEEIDLAPETDQPAEPKRRGPQRRLKRFRSGRQRAQSKRAGRISSRRTRKG